MFLRTCTCKLHTCKLHTCKLHTCKLRTCKLRGVTVSLTLQTMDHACTLTCTHTHTRTHARTHARTHPRTHPRTHARTHTQSCACFCFYCYVHFTMSRCSSLCCLLRGRSCLPLTRRSCCGCQVPVSACCS